jgi:putative ATP-dependent endonuclease of the OLD family
LVTSHSPAVLSRVEPEEVRYCRSDSKMRETTVRSIKLPEDDEEASKFVREAVLAFPELYFARFVLLVEGDSEQIVMPKLAAAKDILIDQSFVAIAPLGGRHVQHFWRLLGHLGIPYATLLDLDLGRTGGAWGRVKTTIEQLIANGAPKEKVLAIFSVDVLECLAKFATCAFKALRLTCKSLIVLAHGRHSIESCKCLHQDARNRK